MYFKDLSRYSYSPPIKGVDHALNIGWLDKRYEFPTGPTPKEVLDFLLESCMNPVNITRGLHPCFFCAKDAFPISIEYQAKAITVGHAEILIRGNDEQVYFSPNMIVHYIKEHSYKPPECYIKAVLESVNRKEQLEKNGRKSLLQKFRSYFC